MRKNDSFSCKFIVTEETYNKFIELFRDHNPLHTDRAFSISKGFSDIVMHGNILNGFISFFIGECLPDKNIIIHSQHIDYSNPVYMNDELIFNARIEEIHESVNVIDFKYDFENQKRVRVAKGKFQIGLLK